MKMEELLKIAIEQGASIETIDKLIGKIKSEEELGRIKSFYEALTGFQSECPEIPKTEAGTIIDAKGNAKVYKFSPLGAIRKITKPFLNKYGLSYRWDFSYNNDAQTILCLFNLYHTDGYSVNTLIEAKLKDVTDVNNDIQGLGVYLTYLQRYTMVAGLGLVTDEDIDAGIKVEDKKTSTIPAPKKVIKTIKEEVKNVKKSKIQQDNSGQKREDNNGEESILAKSQKRDTTGNELFQH